jgi:hypothetical protein
MYCYQANHHTSLIVPHVVINYFPSLSLILTASKMFQIKFVAFNEVYISVSCTTISVNLIEFHVSGCKQKKLSGLF